MASLSQQLLNYSVCSSIAALSVSISFFIRLSYIISCVFKSFFFLITEHYKKHCADKTRPYDGIKELIENIRNAGVYTAVVSNKADYGVQTLCKDYFPGLFDYAVGEREGIRRKPYPDSVNEVLRQFDVDRTQAVYVGDSEVDVQTAANAGMDVCMVGWGFRDEEFVKGKRG